MACDLHTHSIFSDGSYTPEELIRMAEEKGLRALALCDHNTVAGLPYLMAAARDRRVTAVAGIEFTTDYRGKELHMLGLFLPPGRWSEVEQRAKKFRDAKEENNLELIAKLAEAGYPVDYEALKNKTPGGYVNRAHVAAELVRLGHVPTVKAAFAHLLSPEGPYYTPPWRPDVYDTIDFIHSIGAVAVLAHPFLNLTEQELREFLDQGKPDGMETMYTLYDAATQDLASRIALEYGLLPSGGSDFHGAVKPGIEIGTGRGNLRVPDEFYQNLKKAVRRN